MMETRGKNPNLPYSELNAFGGGGDNDDDSDEDDKRSSRRKQNRLTTGHNVTNGKHLNQQESVHIKQAISEIIQNPKFTHQLDLNKSQESTIIETCKQKVPEARHHLLTPAAIKRQWNSYITNVLKIDKKKSKQDGKLDDAQEKKLGLTNSRAIALREHQGAIDRDAEELERQKGVVDVTLAKAIALISDGIEDNEEALEVFRTLKTARDAIAELQCNVDDVNITQMKEKVEKFVPLVIQVVGI